MLKQSLLSPQKQREVETLKEKEQMDRFARSKPTLKERARVKQFLSEKQALDQ